MLIVTKAQMEEIEQGALHFDMTLPRLMENAGSAAASLIRRTFPVTGANIIVFAGKGNNGGDGIVVARRLQEFGGQVVLVLVDGLPASPQSQKMFEFLQLQQVPVLHLDAQREMVETYATHAELVIDAIFGIGFSGSLSGNGLTACNLINSTHATIVALDTPSGVSCDKGVPSFGCVKADHTIAFQLLKPLHILPQSLECCGEVHVVDIGIPPQVYQHTDSHFGTLTSQYVKRMLLPRPADSHKGDYGRLLLMCGSSIYRGAAALAAGGALRSGVGICSLAAPEVVCATVSHHYPEVIYQPLPVTSSGEMNFVAARPLLEKQLTRASAVVFGCGVGRGEESLQQLLFLLKHCRVPLVIDADGLTLLADCTHLLSHTNCPVILTPHPGEMAALANETTSFVQKNRIEVAREFAQKHKVVVALKGAGTVIASPDGRLLMNQTGNPGMATGGSGDVLAGIIGSLLAQGYPLEKAVGSSVWLHGASGDFCAQRSSQQGLLPSDLPEALRYIFAQLQQEKDEK